MAPDQNPLKMALEEEKDIAETEDLHNPKLVFLLAISPKEKFEDVLMNAPIIIIFKPNAQESKCRSLQMFEITNTRWLLTRPLSRLFLKMLDEKRSINPIFKDFS